MRGSIEITKVFKDGTRECICKDNNILTDGLGVGITNIFTDRGSSDLSDHIIGYFQVGLGRLYPENHNITKSKFLSTLDTPLTTEEAYGRDAEIVVDTHQILQYHSPNFSPTFFPQYSDAVFAVLPDSHTTKIIDGVVTYRLTLTDTMANDLNDQPITEFGLFVRDGNSNIKEDQSVLVAYKNFADGSGITKTKDFSLVIDWELKFVDDALSTETPPSSPRNNVVLIMLDDVGVDHLGNYDAINPYDISNTDYPNATPFSKLDDPVNGSSLYPYTPTLSAMADAGMQLFNVRAQPACSPTRANILTGRYNFSVKNYGNTGEGFWGPGIGVVPTSSPRTRGGLRGLNDGFRFFNSEGTLENLAHQVLDDNGFFSAITTCPVIGNFLKKPDINYRAAMFGKWHLNIWEDKEIYCETVGTDTQTIKGSGWAHVALKGYWDHYNVTFANLNSNPIPGVNPISDAFYDTDSWPNNGAENYPTSGKNMGYVNYFVTTRGPQTKEGGETWITSTVSDSGYTSFAQSEDGDDYADGDPSSFTTNYIFSAASSYFNSAEEPFFMYLSPNAPHTPYTWPPSNGIYNKDLSSINQHALLRAEVIAEDSVSSAWLTVNAMLENFDSVLSSFLQGLDENKKANTIFIVTSDNGALGPDIGRRGTFASSLGLGQGTSLGGNYVGSGGLGATYDKMLNLGAYCSSLSPSAVRRGGQGDTANGFKASVYDRGMLVPMFVSGAGVSAGVSSHAMIDLVDIVATIADIAGGAPDTDPQIPPDSISFYNVLTGETNASSHERQYSWGEVFFPIGNSTGNTATHGPYTSSINCGDLVGGMQEGYTPEPTNPRRKRGALTMRFEPDEFIGYLPTKYTQTLSYLINNDSEIQDFYADDGVITRVIDEPLPSASGGLWKVIRPNSGLVGLGSNFAHDVGDLEWQVDDDGDYVLDDNGNRIQTVFTQGQGGKYEELYHLQSTNFSAVDLYELNDYLRESDKGFAGNHLSSSLIVSAIKNSVADGGINNGAANGGQLDNTVHYWNLARIFDAAHRSFQGFSILRRLPSTTLQTPPGTTFPGDDIDY